MRITITHVDGDDETRPVITTVTLDRTIHDGEVAQRLQRDLAALPLADPFATFYCPIGPGNGYTYNTYTLTWYRAGLPVEQASANRSGNAPRGLTTACSHMRRSTSTPSMPTSTRPPLQERRSHARARFVRDGA